MPGSLEYLARVGLDKRGKVIDKKSPMLRLDHQQAVFGQYCERYLDLEHSAKYMQKANFAGQGEGVNAEAMAR